MQKKVVALVIALVVVHASAQTDVTDAQLEAASSGRVVRLGPAPGRTGSISGVPLEVYVARVLAGEGEPNAAPAAQQALAIAIRTYALANMGRHGREGFDLCDGTHCQVPRLATAATRRAAMLTAGQVLFYNGTPAELFYSASCGGQSERASDVWPGAADYPYLQSVEDDVHDGDVPWTVEFTLQDVQRALERVGFDGRLRDVKVDAKTSSGRAGRLTLVGLEPDVVAGDQFRAALGATMLRSTFFSLEKRGDTLRFTGRGYGHGVGMCVIGAGRRAARGETAQAILQQYYPGLRLSTLDAAPLTSAVSPAPPVLPALPAATRSAITARVPAVSSITAAQLEQLITSAHNDLATVLGTSVAPITVRLHESIDTFRLATGRPWWVSSVSEGTSIELAPAALLAQRDGVEQALRVAVADLLVADALKGRPLWVRAGAARYFGEQSARPADDRAKLRCPTDAELTLAISAPAQRDAETRATACFAREYAKTKDWRAVR
jgi:stage II sporulation protein D